jgi:hypothetical protein
LQEMRSLKQAISSLRNPQSWIIMVQL